VLHAVLKSSIDANVLKVAMTVNSRTIKTFLELSPDASDVPLKNGLRVQILPTLDELPKARKHQFAAFIASESILIVWDDEPVNVVSRAADIESELMDIVWQNGASVEEEGNEGVEKGTGNKTGSAERATEVDEESGESSPQSRPTHVLNSVLVAFTLLIITVMLGAAFRSITVEIMVDKGYQRLAFVALIPVQVFFTLVREILRSYSASKGLTGTQFFAQVIVGCIAQCIGPIRQITSNSRYYSAILPRRIRGPTLPHITVQCPVYKEGLVSVIAPTVKSVKKAISTYELQGGSANIFVNDDGLQLISEDARQARIDFYADHNIGWTARPKHGENGFQRRGKFKKASNMNYGLMLSNNVENKLVAVERDEHWIQTDEAVAYERCLKEVVEEDGRAWADGNIRIGDYILLSRFRDELIAYSIANASPS
jgi:hypothetical protein